MATLISDYRNLPSDHCGSGSMRNLLYHYCDLDLTEAEVFGLGSGIDFLFIESEHTEPNLLAFGRGSSMEADVALALDVDYLERTELNDERAWEAVRNEIDEGRPTMLSGDTFYLDYHDSPVHFPAHRFVLLGYDDDRRVAFIADRKVPEPQECSYEGLAKSRNPSSTLSTYNLWGKFADTTVRRSLRDAFVAALGKTAGRMLGTDASQANLIRMSAAGGNVEVTTGLAGLAAFRESLATWPDRPDGKMIAKYVSNTFERYGTGGGNFRKMFGSFLERARIVVPEIVSPEHVELARSSAAKWTELSEHLEQAADGRSEAWNDAGRTVETIIKVETRLFDGLALLPGGEGVGPDEGSPQLALQDVPNNEQEDDVTKAR